MDRARGRSDESRALTDEGWRRLRRAAPAWRALLRPRPEVILTSPLVRARETAAALLDALGTEVEIRERDEVVPQGSTDRALMLLEGEQLDGTDAVAVVGHEPHLGYLLGALLTGSTRTRVPLKKGMLVAVQIEGTTNCVGELRWSLTQKAAGRLG